MIWTGKKYIERFDLHGTTRWRNRSLWSSSLNEGNPWPDEREETVT